MGSGTGSGRKKPWEIPSQEYYYHGTTLQAARQIADSELRPSNRGRAGKGVYLAYDEDSAQGWADELRGNTQNVVLRVRGSALKAKGFSAENDEEATVQQPISAKDIEIRDPQSGNWVPIKKYFRR